MKMLMKKPNFFMSHEQAYFAHEIFQFSWALMKTAHEKPIFTISHEQAHFAHESFQFS